MGATATPRWSSAQLSTLRLAVALTASVLFAFIIGWTGSFIMPVFVCVLLSAGGPAIPIRNGIGLLIMVGVLLGIGVLIAGLLVPHPVACLLIIGWLLLAGQFWAIRGGNQLLIVILMIAILVIPLVALESGSLVLELTGGLYLSIALAVLTCWLAHGLIPDPRLEAAAKADKALPDKQEAYRQALIKTLLMLPVLFAFFVFKMTSDLLVLIFIALLIQVPSAQIGIKGSLVTLVSNGLGGLAAVICYRILVLSPSPVMLGFVVFIVALLFGRKIFSEAATSQIYGTGLNTVIVLLGGATGAFADGAAVDMWVRLAQIAVACAYIVGALSLAENWLKPKPAPAQKPAVS